MGLFDFVKGIGKKNTAAAEPQAAPANTTPAAAAQPAEPSAQEVANKLLGHVKGLGLPITGLSISYNSTSDLATVRGQVQSQADREKIILAVGNIDHVAKVDDQLTVSSPEPESKFYTVKSGIACQKSRKNFMVMPISTIRSLRPIAHCSKMLMIFSRDRYCVFRPDF